MDVLFYLKKTNDHHAIIAEPEKRSGRDICFHLILQTTSVSVPIYEIILSRILVFVCQAQSRTPTLASFSENRCCTGSFSFSCPYGRGHLFTTLLLVISCTYTSVWSVYYNHNSALFFKYKDLSVFFEQFNYETIINLLSNWNIFFFFLQF